MSSVTVSSVPAHCTSAVSSTNSCDQPICPLVHGQMRRLLPAIMQSWCDRAQALQLPFGIWSQPCSDAQELHGVPPLPPYSSDEPKRWLTSCAVIRSIVPRPQPPQSLRRASVHRPPEAYACQQFLYGVTKMTSAWRERFVTRMSSRYAPTPAQSPVYVLPLNDTCAIAGSRQ